MYGDEYGAGDVVLAKMKGLLQGAHGRAKSYGRECTITLEQLVLLYVEICPILGIELVWDNRGTVCHGSPSLDRIDNNRGYVDGNVQIISHRANSLKRDYLLVEWEKMANYMRHCDGEPIKITEEHYKEPLDMADSATRRIRSLRREGITSPIEIAVELDLPVGQVIRYIRQLG